MLRIDSHQHFWQYEPVKHDWIDDAMAVIRKDFLPAHLAPVLQKNNFDGCIAVQADQTEAETDFLLRLQKENNFIKGVVGWVDLRAENIKERLAYYKQFAGIKGFRHVLQGEAPEFMLQQNFIRGIAALKEFDFTYDILIFPKHLPAAITLVQQFPEQKFVIDHIAKPYIKSGLIGEWKQAMRKMAEYPNVYCKISGMVTEANYLHWKKEQFTPYLDVVVEAFGTKRIMYGSDWPVCLVAASYKKMLNIVEEYFASFTVNEQEDFFGNNAAAFYMV
ncbi:amidohydrolase family protein [Ferruginibacter sp. SUN106]|uniref:amidohydrolase family protein n=1 Tax=Ferruginibacter sp. SUN106 TaxID=2978348 RepID=UPI003D35CB8A